MLDAVSNVLHLGIIGRGKTSPDAATGLMEDFIDGVLLNDAQLKIYVAADDTWDDLHKEIIEYWAEDTALLTVAHNDDGKEKSKDDLPDTTSTLNVQRPHLRVVKALTDVAAQGEAAVLLALWDDEDDEVFDAAEIAWDHDIDVFDLTAGMEQITFVDAPEEEEEEAPASDPEPEVQEAEEVEVIAPHITEEVEEEEEDNEAEAEAEEASLVYSEDSLNDLPRAEVKAIAVSRGLVDQTAKTHTPTLIRMILEDQDREEPQEDVPPTSAPEPAEEVRGEDSTDTPVSDEESLLKAMQALADSVQKDIDNLTGHLQKFDEDLRHLTDHIRRLTHSVEGKKKR